MEASQSCDPRSIKENHTCACAWGGILRMSSHAEPRASSDRNVREGNYDFPGGPPRHNYQQPNLPPNAAYAGPRSNGFGSMDAPRQRNGSSTGPANPPNGSGPPRSGSRSGRDRNQTQEIPIRERSQPNVPPGGKSATRICKKCDQPLTGQFVRALGGTYHLECFLCRVSWMVCRTQSCD